MLFKKTKDHALQIHEKARGKYEAMYNKVNKACEELYCCRTLSRQYISKTEELINSIANTPKEFELLFSKIEVHLQSFKETEQYAEQSLKDTQQARINTVAGVAAGTAVASLAPTAMIWVATTFGTASTGTAISSLSGAVATKAALAWLGGGALTAGGAGIAGGQALLALAGPVGWSIAGASAAVSASARGMKNKKIADEVIEEARNITMAGAVLNETAAVIENLKRETELLMVALSKQYEACASLKGIDYQSIPANERMTLGTLVNNTLALAKLLNKTVDDYHED